MHAARGVAVLVAALAAVSLSACGPKTVRTPKRPVQDLIVLLPDEDGGAGAATVSTRLGSVDLDAARESTLATTGARPTPPKVMTESEIKAVFGDLLSFLPPAPRHFTLYFRFESDDLTDESLPVVPEILRAVKNFPAAEVLVVGHTDTSGSSAANIELGLKRAKVVRTLLLTAGLDRSFIDIASHGERDLLVRTADGVLEPRNRRVEITVR